MSVLPVLPTTTGYHFRRQLDATIYRHMEDSRLGAATLCREYGISRSELYRKVRSLTGTSVNRYVRQLRLERARKLLTQHSHESVRQIAFEVGFSDPSYFNRCFKRAFGCTPGELRGYS